MDLFRLALRVTAEGIEDAKKQLADLEKAGKKVATASKEQQAEINKSIGLSRQLAAVVDKTDQAAIANLQTLVRAQKDWAVQVGASAEQLLKIQAVENKLNKTAAAAEKVAESGHKITESSHGSVEGVKKLGNSLEHLATEMLGVNPVAGKLSAVLGEMSLGGPITVGVLAGLAAIGLAYERLTRSAREAKQEVDDLIKSLNQQAKAEHDASMGGMQENLRKLQDAERDAQNNLARVRAQAQGRFGVGALVGGAIMGDVEAAKKDLHDAQVAVEQQQKAIAASTTQTADDIREAGQRADRAIADSKQWLAATLKRLDDEDKKRADDAKRALDARIETLVKATDIDDVRASATRQLQELEAGLTQRIAAGNLTLAQRVELEERLARVRSGLSGSVMPIGEFTPQIGMTPVGTEGEGFGGQMKTLPDTMVKSIPQIINESGKASNKALLSWQDTMIATVNEISETLGDAVYNAFAAAFSGEGVGGVFKALGKTVLSGLGTVFKMIGEQVIAGSVLMAAIKKALLSFNPVVSLAAGIALVALGGAIGGAVGRAAHQGFSNFGSGGTGTGTETLTRLKFVDRFGNPAKDISAMQPIVHNWTVIGTADPKARREISEMVDAHSRRKG